MCAGQHVNEGSSKAESACCILISYRRDQIMNISFTYACDRMSSRHTYENTLRYCSKTKACRREKYQTVLPDIRFRQVFWFKVLVANHVRAKEGSYFLQYCTVVSRRFSVQLWRIFHTNQPRRCPRRSQKTSSEYRAYWPALGMIWESREVAWLRSLS